MCLKLWKKRENSHCETGLASLQALAAHKNHEPRGPNRIEIRFFSVLLGVAFFAQGKLKFPGEVWNSLKFRVSLVGQETEYKACPMN